MPNDLLTVRVFAYVNTWIVVDASDKGILITGKTWMPRY